MPQVTVTAAPTLTAARPAAMASVATDLAFVARVLTHTSSVMAGAVGRLQSNWTGRGGPAFASAAAPLSQVISEAADALFGAAESLSDLSSGIGEAQRMADSAQLLADEANYTLLQLQRSVAETELQGPGGGPALFGWAPTGAQLAAAQIISADQQQAVRLMAMANTAARVAWQSAQRGFDLVTSQAPSVGAALDNTNLGVFNREISRLGWMGMAALAVGAMSSGDDDDGGDDPVVDPANGGIEAEGGEAEVAGGIDADGPDDPIDNELTIRDDQADAKLTVDATMLDPTIAADYNTATDGYQTITTSAEELEADDLSGQLPALRATQLQLRRKFMKHALDFGVAGNQNNANLVRYEEALTSFVHAPDTIRITGTFRRNIPAILNYNPSTLQVVVQYPDGEFLTGWKVTPQDLQQVIDERNL